MGTLAGHQYGGLVTVNGILTKVADVKFKLVVSVHTCSTCGEEKYQEIASNHFNPTLFCDASSCRQSKKSMVPLSINFRKSKFLPFRLVTLQELPEQVSVGHVPQSIEVEACCQDARLARVGDVVSITGILLAKQLRTPEARMSGELLPYLEALSISRLSKGFSEIEQVMPANMDYLVDKLGELDS